MNRYLPIKNTYVCMGSLLTSNILFFYSQENIFFTGLEVDLLRNS
ncbi:MAG: hypothetical protein ACI87N_003592, partial [Flavobacteriales bacterium]